MFQPISLRECPAMHQTPSIPPHAFSTFLSVASRSCLAVLSIDFGKNRLQSFHSGVGSGISHRPIWGVHGSTFQIGISVTRLTHLSCHCFISHNIFVTLLFLISRSSDRPSKCLRSTISSMAKHPEQPGHGVCHGGIATAFQQNPSLDDFLVLSYGNRVL